VGGRRLARVRGLSRPIAYSVYKSAVRAEDFESTVRQAASRSAAMQHASAVDSSRDGVVTSWAISDIARVSLSFSRFGRPESDDESFGRLARLYTNVEDELQMGGLHATSRFLSRTAMEQFSSQIGAAPSLARSAILFGSNPPFSPGRKPKVMLGSWFSDVFGMELDDYMLGVFLADMMAGTNEGLLDTSLLDALSGTPLTSLSPKAAFQSVFDRHLSTTREEFKLANRAVQSVLPEIRLKSSFNPLVDKPFIVDALELPVAPSARFIIDKLSSRSIYYPAMRHFGGGVFATANVWPERRYGPKASQADSVDWFLELEDFLVLVECKAIGPNEAVRAGALEMLSFVDEKIGKGIRQINKSVANLARISAAGSALPSSKKLVGLVVTLEDFFANNNPFSRAMLPSADVPTGILSVREFEQLTTGSASDVNSLIHHELEKPMTNNELYINSLSALPTSETMNPILDEAFESYALFRLIESIA
jgi:hypothetical protein